MPDLKILTAGQSGYWGAHGNASIRRITGQHVIAAGDTRAANDRDAVVQLRQGIIIHDLQLLVRNGVGATCAIDVGTRQLDGGPLGTGTWDDDRDFFFANRSVNQAGGWSSAMDGTRHPPLLVNENNVWLETVFRNAISSSATLSLDWLIHYEAIGS